MKRIVWSMMLACSFFCHVAQSTEIQEQVREDVFGEDIISFVCKLDETLVVDPYELAQNRFSETDVNNVEDSKKIPLSQVFIRLDEERSLPYLDLSLEGYTFLNMYSARYPDLYNEDIKKHLWKAVSDLSERLNICEETGLLEADGYFVWNVGAYLESISSLENFTFGKRTKDEAYGRWFRRVQYTSIEDHINWGRGNSDYY